VDTDGDGLADKAEIYYETNSTVQDTDGDGYLDGEEVAFGSNPKDANSLGNRAPTDLNATTVLSILENQPVGTFITEFNATDSDANNTLTYSLADGNGSGGNPFFTLDPNGTLVSAVIFDFENNASSYSIRVRVSDQHGYKMEGNFSISLLDLNEAPADLNTTAPLQVAENQPVGTVVGQLTAHDPDFDSTTKFEKIDLPPPTAGSSSRISETIDIGNSSAKIKLWWDPLTARDRFQIYVGGKRIFDTGEYRSDVGGRRTEVVNGETRTGDYFEVDFGPGKISVTEANDNRGNGDFLDYHDAQPTSDYPFTDTPDGNSSIVEFVINDEGPEGISKSSGSIWYRWLEIEKRVQEEPSTTLTFSLVDGSNDNHFFSVDTNGTLRTASTLDFEANSTLTIQAKVRDQQDAWIKQNFTVQILNVLEDLDGDGIEDAYDTDDDGDGYSDAEEIAYGSDPRDANSVADTLPTGLTLSSLKIMENQPIGTVVGQFTVIDPDLNDSHIVKFNDINENISHNHLFTIDANNTLRTAVVFDYENNSSTLYLRVKAKQNKVGVFWEFFTLSLVNDTVDDLSPPSENNQTSTPIIDHNTTGDHNATQPPLIDQNSTLHSKGYLAIVRTLDSRNEQNGTSRLYGKILTDGGSIISEKGFLVSTNLQFLNSERISGIDHNQTDPFFADYQTTQNGQTFYYRAYVRNNVGESLGGIKKISPSTPRSWWNELPEIAGGWRTSTWFGSFRPYPGGWLYHVDLGWLFSHAGESRDLWLWNEQLGWHWTAQGVYPHLFLHSSANWLYFITKKDGRPYFYDYDTGKLK
uniref:cadherin domain-containing protein n=1 Tax=Candidatus Seribacter sulfatis TaxID=3381756 RepID=UPI00389AEABC